MGDKRTEKSEGINEAEQEIEGNNELALPFTNKIPIYNQVNFCGKDLC